TQDLCDARELWLGSQLARVRLDELQRSADQLRDGNAVAAAGCEIHHRRLEPIPGSEPLVLRIENPVIGDDLLARVEALRVVLDESLAESGERDHVLELGHRVADPDLDRPEARVQANV